ncbi:phosphonate metabolism protein/1,5-bisphosphokinase (PRPP-forming) PhnN [uncultured Cohaesibacter sp.]|uniref:phosphonate metabolism protein/1,5-bisphosphokinase (PRPP-forming) PhnN n=1 Tax=uncultured Cohaesibacter sp. TaxID=1002546 RepID=UPI00292FDDD5|nr:phosphonate metabolism protein/1,5-bisphosphokinase (PRPP-forming) PhnN [uncultured Cohaesibacter sp.]
MYDRSQEKQKQGGLGPLILMVGPSGSGKDSLLDYARECLKDDPRVLFVRRCITREKDDPNEDHQSMSLAAFQKAEMAGDFVISWGAHGLRYGLPVSMLDHLEKGGVAIANGSRKTIPVLKDRFSNFKVINLTVEPHILASRLASRGRETAEEIEKRLARTKSLAREELFGDETVHLDNSGELATAGKALVELILSSIDQ